MYNLILRVLKKKKKQQHTLVIIFNSYNQLYNMQYSKMWNMASGVHLRYLVKDPILS